MVMQEMPAARTEHCVFFHMVSFVQAFSFFIISGPAEKFSYSDNATKQTKNTRHLVESQIEYSAMGPKK